jgi:hypothetical protein
VSDDFHAYFDENMEALGLPAPAALFGTLQAALTTATTLAAQVDKHGPRVTLGELMVAGTRLEQLSMVAALSAAYYTGAVIGSVAVATGRVAAGGLSLGDVLATADVHGLHRPWLPATLRRWPALHDARFRTRLPAPAAP